MIERDEIEAKSAELSVHTTNVQRDYVFGWLLFGIYQSPLKERLVLKGGNCLRKAYFAAARFSSDLDFATEGALDSDYLRAQLDAVCVVVSSASGVVFDCSKNIVREKTRVDKDLRVWEARLFFRDFFGKQSAITISVRMDVTQFERFWLPTIARPLLHGYSDAQECAVDLRCMKLEEVLASKLKCLIQRRHVADLYDYVYWLFFGAEVVNVTEVVSVFLKKTIYQRAPRVALDLLLNLPFAVLGVMWEAYIVAPSATTIEFGSAVDRFQKHLLELFGSLSQGRDLSLSFFSSALRTPIMEAGSAKKLLRLRYHGVERDIEPYSLQYRVRKDGVGREYFYGYDRTGGRSSLPGIKSFVAADVESLSVTDTVFEPRMEIEVAKAGEVDGSNMYFGRTGSYLPRTMRSGMGHRSTGTIYVVQCYACSREFQRTKHNTSMKPHKDQFGQSCYGRSGFVSRTEYR